MTHRADEPTNRRTNEPMSTSASDANDRGEELARLLEETTDRVTSLLGEEGDRSPEEEAAVRETVDELAGEVREAGFEDLLRAGGFDDLPEDPSPADLPDLVGRADAGELDTVRRLLALEDLSTEWNGLDDEERTDRLEDLFDGEGDRATGAEETKREEPQPGEETAETTDEGEKGEETADSDAESEGLGAVVSRIREASERLSESAEDGEDGTEGARADEPTTADAEADEAGDESDRERRRRRERFSSVPSRRPDMSAVTRRSTMPRRK